MHDGKQFNKRMTNNLTLSLTQAIGVGSSFGIYSRNSRQAIVRGLFSSSLRFVASRMFGEVGFLAGIGIHGFILILTAATDPRINIRSLRENLILIREVMQDPRVLRIVQQNQLRALLDQTYQRNRMREITYLNTAAPAA